MKDSFGGTFMLYIMLIFFVIFVCLLAAAINLSKTFRIKNTAINYLERYSSSIDDAKEKIDDYLGDVAYVVTSSKVSDHCSSQGGNLTDLGVCIVPVNNGSYYKVFSYIVMDFPLFHTGILIPIGGETKTIIG